MDFVAEQIVKKENSSQELIKKTLIIAMAVIISIIAIFLCITLSSIILVLVVFAIWGAIYLIQNMYTEYEYTIVNGELEVDKIVAKKKRFQLLSVEVKNFTGIKKYDNSDNFFNDEGLTRYHCSNGTVNHLFYADFESDENGKSRLYFSPSQEMLENIAPFLKPELKSYTENIIKENKNKYENEDEKE